ncbi:ABC-type bacteriocin/lantibiotic exporter [Herbaspirillum sp. CF444]|uniref:peptidase domain-containing ABC transporter n=1 Tax=Herbaspirillum sp. CF444 TaxID=1144319 RepID=UPI0002725800|nr:peptidase domain-containing ABC transporter [Herbaspirillum sp. CF444]EJL86439.1 ABC-type bacteriocin/lantibiotic exporter [Herbaspirillum sp. CF444]
MSFLNRLNLGSVSRLSLILQTETSECGLACLGMIAGYHGYRTDMNTLRRRFSISLKGATLAHLMRMANELELSSRPLKLDIQDLSNLRLPCILHWNFHHFVVLKEVGRKSITIYDPGVGIRKLPPEEVSKAFTGVALELWPGANFKPQEIKQHVSIRNMMGRVTGLRRSFAQILLLALGLELFSLVSPFYMQWVLDNVLVASDSNLLTTLALGFALLVLVQQTASAIRSWMLIYMGTMLNIQWRSNVFMHLIRLPVTYFEKRHLGDVVSRFGSVDAIQKTLTTSFLEALLDGLMTVVTLVMMFIYSPVLPWISLGAMALYALGRWIWYAPLRNATEEQLIHAAKQQSHFLETMRGIKTIKLFQRQEERHASWLTTLIDQINADLRSQKMQLFYRAFNGTLFGLERILVIWMGAGLVIKGAFTAGVLIAFSAYREQFNNRISSLIDKLFEVNMLRLQGERLADIVFSEQEITAPANRLQEDGNAIAASIELIDVHFRYAEQEPLVLNGIDLKITPGESIAIVGPSGCGKSTLTNLMLGVLPLTRGEIFIGGIPLQQIGLDRLRGMVGTVMQDDVLFAGSIADNISFFDADADPYWIQQCAAMAAIDTEIAAMPMKYNTLVGDMGTVLSGGQKQRILLSRALYKKPRILFLDEATSHLDIEREQQVNTSVKMLDITRIIIAHRPETIASANRIVVLHQGKIVQDMRMPET